MESILNRKTKYHMELYEEDEKERGLELLGESSAQKPKGNNYLNTFFITILMSGGRRNK